MLNYPIGPQRTYSGLSLSDFDYILDLVSADFSGPNHRRLCGPCIATKAGSAFFSGLDKLIVLVFLLIIVKMPTIVVILTFMSRKIVCSAELSMVFLL